MKTVKGMQRAEHEALRELLIEYQNVVTQRDKLRGLQCDYIQQVCNLHI